MPTRLFELYSTDILCSKLRSLAKPALGKFSPHQLFTVGTPAYLSHNTKVEYEQMAIKNNESQWLCFESLYEEVLASLGLFFNEKIFFSLRAAIPGFHVILLNEDNPKYHGGVAHIDTSYNNVPMFSEINDPIEHYSFTMLLSESADDIGLVYWMPGTSELEAEASNPTEFVPYRCGELTLFSSELVHRISPFSSQFERITLQGHLLRFNGKLLAYW